MVWLDIAQTAALFTICAALIYALWLLRFEIRQASRAMREVFGAQKRIEESLERTWKRIDEVEARQGVRQPPEVIATLADLSNRLGRLEEEAAGRRPRPPSQ